MMQRDPGGGGIGVDAAIARRRPEPGGARLAAMRMLHGFARLPVEEIPPPAPLPPAPEPRVPQPIPHASTPSVVKAPRPPVFGRTAPGAPRTMPIHVSDVVVALMEAVAIALSGSIAQAVITLSRTTLGPVPPDGTMRVTILAIIFYALAAHMLGGHAAEVRFSYRQAANRAVSIWLYLVAFLGVMALLMNARLDVTPRWAVMLAIIGGAMLVGARVAGVGISRWLRATGVFDRRTAIVGTGALAQTVATYLAQHQWLTLSIAGLYDDRVDTGLGADGRAGMADLLAAIRSGSIDQVFIALPDTEEARIAAVLERLALTPARVRRTFDIDPARLTRNPIVLLGDMPLMNLSDRPLVGLDRAVKSLADRSLALLMLVAFAPLFAIIALAIRIETPGPIFFRQEREGYNCRIFRIWKFRSMYHDRCTTDALVQASRGDPRVTRVGAWLRRSSLDEIPQILNVLAGEMSLIGPRPHVVTTRAGERVFSEIVRTYPARHRVKPGITGWAQVCGWRGETDTEGKLIGRLEHDLYYCENWSIRFDLSILLRTVLTVPFQRTAY